MKGRRIKLIDGDEFDVMCAKGWYKYLTKAGVSAGIKRRIRRRDRHNRKLIATADYWIGVSECECDSQHPIGGCLLCDMKEIREVL